MSQRVRAFFEGLKEAVQTMADVAYSPGMQDFVAHGAHEAASALFNGSAFVMYPRGTREDHGQEIEAPAPEQDRGMGY